MMNKYSERIDKFRELMQKHDLDAYLVFHTDPHHSEYPPRYYQERTWLSGFTGSAGNLIITQESAVLLTDARYYLQAKTELSGTGIHLLEAGADPINDLIDYLSCTLDHGSKIGVNPSMISVSQANRINFVIDQLLHTKLIYPKDLVKSLWKYNRPSLSEEPILLHPLSYSGESTLDKITRIRKHLGDEGVDGYIFSALDEVAWVFNIRGQDSEYNPIAIAYAYIGLQESVLFVNPKKLSEEVKREMKNNGVRIENYKHINQFLSDTSLECHVAYDASKTTWKIYECIKDNGGIALESPITHFKAIKNETEIAGFHKAMKDEGIALTQFFYSIKMAIKKNQKLSELDAMKMLHEYRKQSPHFVEESFCTIAGFAEHGAIIHYKATPESNCSLDRSSFFLVDSGGQYQYGTTDITRTVHLGTPSLIEKNDYTLVLKSHIAVANAKFPNTAHGVHLDMFARQPLWNAGFDFPHGTGHGVGSFLNVHEGPQALRLNDNGVVIKPGMVCSNEPGIYREGKYGIRIENLVLCKKYKKTAFGEFLCFENLTLFPYDRKCINKNLLNADEINWINNYHKMVYLKLADKLEIKTRKWLFKQCKKI